MKKTSLIALFLIVSLSFVGCSKVKLEPGEVFITYKKGSSITTFSVSEKDAKNEFGIRLSDSKKEMKDELTDYFKNIYGNKFEITDIKKGKDYIEFTYEVEAPTGQWYRSTLEEYAEKRHYDDMDEMAEREELVFYKNKKSADGKDLEKHSDDYVESVRGGKDGTYYRFEGNIIFVSENLKYKKISNDTIYVKRNSSNGIVIFKK